MPESDTTIATIATLAAYLPPDRAAQVISGAALARVGVALIADISGFTPLTEALARELSPARGAEELTRALDSVFAPLIDEISAHGGSVVKFGGDALIVWFPRQGRQRRAALLRRALSAAARMQAAIARHGRVATPAGTFTLTMKVGLAYGPVLRTRLGSPELGYEDVIGGATLDRMAEAEHHAGPGEVLLDPLGLPPGELPEATERRDDFLVVAAGHTRAPRRAAAAPAGWGSLAAPGALVQQLRPYVPPEVYEAIRDGREHPAELKPVVSIFVQFTGISFERAAEAEPRLAAYFAAAQAAAGQYGGRVNRLITGDKGSVLHLIFGAPRAVEDLERRAALCALELLRAGAGIAFISGQRIGMALGRAFAGPVGSPARHDYTVMGDAINLSARLMQRAEPGQIVVDAVLAERLSGGFVLADLGAAQLKGKAGSVALFALQAAAARVAGPALGLVAGREAELSTLRRQVAAARRGQGGLAVLLGDLGMGKSHLLAALRAEGGLAWAQADASSYGRQRGGALLSDLLRDMLGLPDDAALAAQALSARLAELLGERQAGAATPYLARFLGLPLDQRQAGELEALAGENLRWRIFELARELVRAAATRGPLVLALDDLQWADPTSLEMLEELLPLSAQHALLVILAARPSADPRLGALLNWPGATLLALGGLAGASAGAIVRHHAPLLAAEAVARLVQRGAGNPLFLVELARTASSGDIEQLPDTIQGLLLAQIDRLPAETRLALQLAAVLGDNLAPQLLGELWPGQNHGAILEELVRGGFLTRSGDSLRFRHGLIRESAYHALLYERRRAYHGGAAAAIERLYPTQLAERSIELAEHHERAEHLGAAARYHGQAADAARLLFANQEAEAGYRHVLELLARDQAEAGLLARTYLKLAQVKMNAGDFAAAQDLYDRAFGLLAEAGAGQARQPGRTRARFRRGESEPETLDPGLAQTAAALSLASDLFEGLVAIDADLNVVPAAAWRWHVRDQGRRYVFELRPGACWSDGRPLTAHDFAFAWRRNLDPQGGAPMSAQLYPLTGARLYHAGRAPADALGVRALDEHTLDVELDQPIPHLLYLMAHPITFPLPEHAVRASGQEWWRPPRFVGNGRFLPTTWKAGKYLDLRHNPRYERRVGNLEQVRIRFGAPSDDLAHARALDMIRCEDRPELIRRHPGQVLSLQYFDTYMLAFACGHAPFDSVACRRAFAMATNRERLASEVWGGLQQHATGGVVPPGVPGHSPGIGLPLDPAAARSLLAACGPLPERLVLGCLPGLGATPAFLRDCWRDLLGVAVSIVPDVAVEELLEGVQAGRFHLAVFGWNMDFPEASDILDPLFSGDSPLNHLGWRNATFDALLEQARQETYPLDRFERYHRADRLLVGEQAVVVPLYHSRTFALLQPGFGIAGETRVLRGGRLPLDQIMRV
jgi:ABC-type oligopeptide transport system substrate-binding subunit/class 3 adenylate cyclase